MDSFENKLISTYLKASKKNDPCHTVKTSTEIRNYLMQYAANYNIGTKKLGQALKDNGFIRTFSYKEMEIDGIFKKQTVWGYIIDKIEIIGYNPVNNSLDLLDENERKPPFAYIIGSASGDKIYEFIDYMQKKYKGLNNLDSRYAISVRIYKEEFSRYFKNNSISANSIFEL